MKHPFAKSESQLDPVIAEQILSNVFMTCGREVNSVPLEALTSYSNYRKERYALQRSVIIATLALFLLLPLLFFAASVTITLTNPHSDENPVYSVSIDTKIPIRQIEARLNEKTVPLYEEAPGQYTVTPRDNGALHILITLVNRQVTALDMEILGVDNDAPKLLSTEFKSKAILFYLYDDDSGIDYEAVTLTGEDGQVVPLIGYDEEEGCLTLPYPTQTLHVVIPDLRGNELTVNLRPQG